VETIGHMFRDWVGEEEAEGEARRRGGHGGGGGGGRAEFDRPQYDGYGQSHGRGARTFRLQVNDGRDGRGGGSGRSGRGDGRGNDRGGQSRRVTDEDDDEIDRQVRLVDAKSLGLLKINRFIRPLSALSLSLCSLSLLSL